MPYRVLCLLTLFALAACAPTRPPAPTATPTPVATSTPQAQQFTPFDDLAQGINPIGFPTLGDPAAPIQLVEYGSYDNRASARSHTEILLALLPRIRAGEVVYSYVPLYGTGTIGFGQAAAEAALCALDQGRFWDFHTRLFTHLLDVGDAAYAGNALVDIADATGGIDRTQYDACRVALPPALGAVLEAARADAIAQENYTGTPTLLVNGAYVLNELYSLNLIIDQIMARADGNGGVTALDTPTPILTATPDVVLPSLAGESFEAPLSITLPEGWQRTLNETMIVNDVDGIRAIPFAVWNGAVTGGNGTIAMLWGFPNLTLGNPLEAELGIATPTPDLSIDGRRLLRLAVMEQGCNIGTDVTRNYPIGGVTGVGTEWSAVGCPTSPTTRGWFVGTQQFGVNYVFFVYFDPIDPNSVTPEERLARDEVEAILQTVQFRALTP